MPAAFTSHHGGCIMLIDPVALHQVLMDHFDLEELRTLCFCIHVDYEGLPGEGKIAKARELVSYMERHNRLRELATMLGYRAGKSSVFDVLPPVPVEPTQPSGELSPFVAGPPITHPRHFFGRERELKRLFNLLKHPPLQNAAIIGSRRSGKTSLLLHLKNITTFPLEHLRPGQRADWLPEPNRYYWIYVDFQDPRMGNQEGLLRYLLTCLNLPVPTLCDLDHFLGIVCRNLNSPTVILLDEIGVALRRYPELDNIFWMVCAHWQLLR